MSALESLLIEKKQELERRYEDSKDNENYWRTQVDELYRTIKTWLSPLETKKLLACHINENPLGPVYEDEQGNRLVEGGVDKSLTIEFFNDEKIVFEDMGIEVFGAFGRIHMKMELEKILIELDEKGGRWSFIKKEAMPEDATLDFNQKNFEAIIIEFVKDF